MRAIYLKDLAKYSSGEILRIDGAVAHHLLKVVRLRSNEELKLLSGQGHIAQAKIESLSKNELLVKIEDVASYNYPYQIDLAIGLPKKDAHESIVKSCVEMGVARIYPLSTQFSQPHEVNLERLERMMISALEQSNNPYLPLYEEGQTLEKLKDSFPQYKNIYYFSSTLKNLAPAPEWSMASDRVLLVIGPEGGLAATEEELLLEYGASAINLPTPILRSPTAACVALGYLLGASINN